MINNNKYITTIIPVDERNIRIAKGLFTSRGELDIRHLKDIGVDISIVVQAKSNLHTLEDVIQQASSYTDVSLLEHIVKLDIDRTGTCQRCDIGIADVIPAYAQSSGMVDMLSNENKGVTINVNSNIPDACNKCKHGKAVQAKIDNEDRLIEEQAKQITGLKEFMVDTLTKINPNIDFNKKLHKFSKRPHDDVIMLYYIKLLQSKNLDEFNVAFNNIAMLESDDIFDNDNLDLETYKIMQKINELVAQYLAVYSLHTSPSSELGEAISNKEAEDLEGILYKITYYRMEAKKLLKMKQNVK